MRFQYSAAGIVLRRFIAFDEEKGDIFLFLARPTADNAARFVAKLLAGFDNLSTIAAPYEHPFDDPAAAAARRYDAKGRSTFVVVTFLLRMYPSQEILSLQF